MAAAVGPPLALARWLKAEGPLLLVAVWSALCIGALWAAGGDAAPSGAADAAAPGPRRWRFLVRILAGLIGLAGLTVALVQINVARRSLAEAWLELARRGQAFGFFSFFAVELYALLCLGAGLLTLSRRLAAAAATLASGSLFAVGVILDWSWALAGALVLALAVPLLATGRSAPKPRDGAAPDGAADSRPPLPEWRRRAMAVGLPAAFALIASVPFAVLPAAAGDAASISFIDFTPLVIRLAPSFPLLLDVPGYGYGIGSSRLNNSVYLSDGALYGLEGEPLAQHYLVSAVYRDWTGSGWREAVDDPAAPSPAGGLTVVKVDPRPEKPDGALRLRLLEDFYNVVPLDRATVAVELSNDAPDEWTVARSGALTFATSARRGLIADLRLYGAGRAAIPPDAGYSAPSPDPDGRRSALAARLKDDALAGLASAGAQTDDRGGTAAERAVVKTILAYLADGFTYSLRVRDGLSGEGALERFLFENRSGYCLHFATAFALLARDAGMAVRLVEGYRTVLDERGFGALRGVDSHAWPEVWLGGGWVRIEPTPPFASADPFAYLDANDAAARRQLTALFGPGHAAGGAANQKVSVRTGQGTAAWPIAGAVLAVFAAAGCAGAVYFRTRADKLRRRARRLVRWAGRRGIAGPESLGWTGWAAAVEAAEARAASAHSRSRGSPARTGSDKAAAARRVAADMLTKVFRTPVR
jgi:transglutaminase-like putative cysteine protease